MEPQRNGLEGLAYKEVFAGTVISLRAEKRRYPEDIDWVLGEHIITTMTVELQQSPCEQRATEEETIEIHHFGGTLPNGEGERGTDSPRSLRIGQSYLFIATRSGGELFLENGARGDLLTATANRYRSWRGKEWSDADIRTACGEGGAQ